MAGDAVGAGDAVAALVASDDGSSSNAAATVAFGIGAAYAAAAVAAVPGAPEPPLERPAPPDPDADAPPLELPAEDALELDDELEPLEYVTWIGRFATLCASGRSPRMSSVVSRPGW